MKLTMTMGLPASGKTTWAKDIVSKSSGKTKRVNKDDLRMMIDAGAWSPEREKMILELRDLMIGGWLSHGYNVIVDDTNLHPKHLEALRNMSKLYQAEFEIKDFTDTPLETCIERDLKRTNSVGKKVILNMYRQFLKPIPPIVVHDDLNPDAIICDIDGTLALFGEKNPYDRDFENDKVNGPVRDILNKFYKDGIKIIITSGRKDTYKKVTEEWLDIHLIPHDKLLMREADDTRKDSILKKELYEIYIKGQYNVRFVLDDRNQVVELWRSLGLPCFQVASGDF